MTGADGRPEGAPAPLRVAFHTLGCKVNHAETAALREAFRQDGFAVVPFEDAADVYVVNTCTVTGQAARKTGQLLRRAGERAPGAVVVAVGCHVQLSEGAYPDADVLIGTQGRSEAPRLARAALAARAAAGGPCALAEGAGDAIPAAALDRRAPLPRNAAFEDADGAADVEDVRAFLKIQDGCDGRCAYCTIPLARGPERSRPPAAAVAEARRLAAAGCREIVLAGIHVASYGKGLSAADGLLPGPGRIPLLDLAVRIADLPGIVRVRLGSIEPETLDAAFAQAAAAVPGLCPHFHVPLQSGSAATLARMGRRYGPERYREALAAFRAAFPEGAVTADAIAGFPGETEAEFEESLAFCAACGFSRLHVFRYSDRPGTAAAGLSGRVPDAVVAERVRRLQDLSDGMALAFHAGLVGKERLVLVESFGADGAARGYTPEYVFARIGKGGGPAAPALGALVRMRVESSDRQGVRGALLPP